MTTVLIILSLPFLLLAAATVIAIPLTIIDYLGELFQKVAECIRLHRIRRAERKRLLREIRVWTMIARECDSNTQAEDKGYAIARLVNYHHQIDMLG